MLMSLLISSVAEEKLSSRAKEEDLMSVSCTFGGQVGYVAIGLIRSPWLNGHEWMESIRCTLRDHLSIAFHPGGIQFRHSEITS